MKKTLFILILLSVIQMLSAQILLSPRSGAVFQDVAARDSIDDIRIDVNANTSGKLFIKLGTNLSPKLSGDDILLATGTERITFGNGTNQFYEPTSGTLQIMVGGNNVMSFSSTNASLYQNLTFSSSKTWDIGSTTKFAKDIYTDRMFVASDGISIAVTADEMMLTDISGTYSLTDLASGASPIDTVALGTIAPLNSDTIPLFVFGGGHGVVTDTASFATDAIYGSWYNASSDTFVIVGIHTILMGSTPSMTVDVQWHATFNSGSATHLFTTDPTVTSTTIGDVDTSPNNTLFLPSQQMWMKTPIITTKPYYAAVTVYGYKKNSTW